MKKLVRAVLPICAVLAAGSLAAPAGASAAGLNVSVVTWDIIGIKSNNTGLSTGPGPGFPVGVKVCNSSGGTLSNVQTAFAFTSANSDITLSNPSTDSVASSLADGACAVSYFSVDVNRVAGARGTNRSYVITAADNDNVSPTATGTTGTRTLYVQSLIAQNRNVTHKIAGAGGCNADYTVCDPAPTDLTIGNTYTYKLYAETSTGYEQVESFLSVPGTVFRVESVEAEYQTPSGATAPTPYANACGWTMNGALADFGSCTGPVVAPWAPGGKAGNKMVLTYELKVLSGGSGTMNSLIYDFSGGSFHYNSDFGDPSKSITFTASTKWPLDVAVSGTGQVSSAPAGITCGTVNVSCDKEFADGTSVTLTATEDGTNAFDAGTSVCPNGGSGLWSGPTGTPPNATYTCTVSMTAARSATAVFAGPNYYPLDVQTDGDGGVTANTGTINCSLTQSDCAYGYQSGTSVVLTATPAAGNTFDPSSSVCPGTGWTAAGGGTYTCTVSMTAAKNATAVFSPTLATLYTLTGSVTAGNGTITSDPTGIDCDETAAPSCAQSYSSGTRVTLTATPKEGYQFVSWGGACASAGSDLTCTLDITGDTNVTAQYEPIPAGKFPLSVSKTGTGTVTGGGIDCGTTCVKDFDPDTKVTLTATPGSGYSFDPKASTCPGTGWTAAANGSYTCEVTMDKAQEAKVVFVADVVIRSTSVDGPVIDTKVRVPGPGRLTQRATRLEGGKRITACRTAPKRTTRAQTVTLRCLQTYGTRMARRKGPVVVRLCTTFTPADGAATTKCRRIVLPSTKPNYTG